MQLVTVDEARAHLRLDDFDSSGGADDPWLAIFIPAISDAVRAWLKDDARLYVPARDAYGNVLLDSSEDPIPEYDSNGEPVVAFPVKAAVLIELASQFRFRDGKDADSVQQHEGHGYVLCRAATALLAPLRRPTVA